MAFRKDAPAPAGWSAAFLELGIVKWEAGDPLPERVPTTAAWPAGPSKVME